MNTLFTTWRPTLFGFLLTACSTGLTGCPTAKAPIDAAEHGDEHGDEHDDKHDEAHAVSTTVRLSPEAIATNGIRTAPAKRGRLGAGVEVPAEIALAPNQLAHVTLLVPGRISEVKKSVGDKVKAGDLIALVESAELGAAQSARTQAEAEFNVASKAFERQKELKTAGLGTERTYDEAEAALQRAEAELTAANQRTRVYGSGGTGTTVALRSPLDGEIVQRHASVGEVAQAGGEPLFVVANLHTVVVEARVYEKDVARAVVGTPIRLTLQAYPGQAWDAKLDYVAPLLDDVSRTLTVRAVLKNDGRLKPGLFGNVVLLAADDEQHARAIVPADAVQRTSLGDVVFVPSGSAGVFQAVPVVVSARRDGEAEVNSGLAPDAIVVVEGAFVLKSEMLRGELGDGHHD